MKRILFTLAASTALLAAGPSAAATLAGLVDGKTLVWIDTEAKKVTGQAQIEGATLVGIDVRPADGMLYGIAADGTIYTVDPKSGKTMMKSKLSEKMPSGTITMDFNPAADRLRLMSSDGTSLRINVDDGKTTVDGSHKFAETDMHKSEKPNIVAGAYTNSIKGTKETTLLNIDGTIGGLIKQAPPNDGVLNAVGKLGPKISGPVAFDIWSDGSKNVGWLAAGGTLHMIDLTSGKATSVGEIAGLKGSLTDLAVLPAS